MAFRYRSQPAGLTADDLLYQQVMGTRFVYDEFGTVVELWQLEHRLVVEAQQIQRENYFDGKYYPQAILRALFPTRAPSEDPRAPGGHETPATASRSGRREARPSRAPGAGEKRENRAAEFERPPRPPSPRSSRRRPSRSTSGARPSAEHPRRGERAEKRAKAELAAEHQRLPSRRLGGPRKRRNARAGSSEAAKLAKARAKEDKDAGAGVEINFRRRGTNSLVDLHTGRCRAAPRPSRRSRPRPPPPSRRPAPTRARRPARRASP